MKRLLVISCAAGLAASALAQSTVLYTPVRTLADQAIKLKGWGSGTIGETDELAFEGGRSIRVSTRNYFQGGVMMLGNPVDLSTAFTDKNNLIRFVLRVSDMSLTFAGGGAGGGAELGGASDLGGAGGAAAAGGGVRPGGGQRGAPPPGTVDTNLKVIRVIVATTDGKRSEAYVPIATGGAGERGWRFVAVPLQAISGFADTNKIVSEIALAGDTISTFYVGEIRLVNDSTPIQGDINYRQLNLALGDEIEFVARGFAGASVLKYSWDFDASNGIQEDAVGQTVKRKFRKPGKFIVTLTITDVFGLKKPYQTTCEVTVNP